MRTLAGKATVLALCLSALAALQLGCSKECDCSKECQTQAEATGVELGGEERTSAGTGLLNEAEASTGERDERASGGTLVIGGGGGAAGAGVVRDGIVGSSSTTSTTTSGTTTSTSTTSTSSTRTESVVINGERRTVVVETREDGESVRTLDTKLIGVAEEESSQRIVRSTTAHVHGDCSRDDSGCDECSECKKHASKVTLCHVPPGNPANEHTITVGASAVDAHLSNHDDYLGPCDGRNAGKGKGKGKGKGDDSCDDCGSGGGGTSGGGILQTSGGGKGNNGKGNNGKGNNGKGNNGKGKGKNK